MNDTLSGLRKYGFSFITGLLATDSILGQAGQQASIVISPPVKLAVMIVTLVLISALYATDRFYRTIQEGAAVRARVIEKNTQMQLATTIASFYARERAWVFIDGLYGLFAVATGILGAAVLLSYTALVGIMILAAGATILFIVVVSYWEGVKDREAKEVLLPDSR